MNKEDALMLLQDCVDMLGNATSCFAERISAPIYNSNPRPHFIFKDPDINTYIVLKCVRIGSGFNASLELLKHGYAQEVGVILRSTLEFMHDLEFIFEGLTNKDIEEKIKLMIDSYFSGKLKNTQQLLDETKKKSSIPRQIIYASIGRLYGNDNPYRFRQIAKILEEKYSGYVHGNYHHIMEMWNQNLKCFEFKGQPYVIVQWLGHMRMSQL